MRIVGARDAVPETCPPTKHTISKIKTWVSCNSANKKQTAKVEELFTEIEVIANMKADCLDGPNPANLDALAIANALNC